MFSFSGLVKWLAFRLLQILYTDIQTLYYIQDFGLLMTCNILDDIFDIILNGHMLHNNFALSKKLHSFCLTFQTRVCAAIYFRGFCRYHTRNN